jgi:peptidyl-prolyl cis-trans isomerase D
VNFADEIGVVATDEAVAEEIMNIESFQKDGKFNKEQYLQILKQNRISIKDFEADIKRGILVQKIQNILNIKNSTTEDNLLTFSSLLADRVSIDTIKPDDIKIDTSVQKLEDYWNINKTKYNTVVKYSLATKQIDTINSSFSDDEIQKYYKDNIVNFNGKKLDEVKSQIVAALEDKATKKEANKLFYKIKKDEIKDMDKLELTQHSLLYSAILDKLQNVADGDILKPIKNDKGYIVVKVVKIQRPRTMTFKEAQSQVRSDYKKDESLKELKNLASSRVSMFSGVDKGYITQTSSSIDGLSDYESKELIKYIFAQNSAKGYKIIGDKAILYKITDQKISNPASDINSSNISKVKSDIINNSLIKRLKTRYKVENYYKIEG